MFKPETVRLPEGVQNLSTLVDLLEYRAEYKGDTLAYAFLEKGEELTESFTFSQMAERAQAIGAFLQQKGLAGQRAMLLFPSGLDYVAAFYGCLYAGVVAVPAYPPQMGRKVDRITQLSADASVSAFLCNQRVFDGVKESLPGEALKNWFVTDHIDPNMANQWIRPQIEASSLAFLQYTSGSTGMPKGVMVSHGNLLRNQALIYEGFEFDGHTIALTWLPLFHDMGLIGHVIQPLYFGAASYIMSPLSFMQKPIRWVQALSKYKATVSGAPNFAYSLVAAKATEEEIAELDLSSWVLAYNGSEPVRAESLRAFANRFKPASFNPDAFCPCYGMAEYSLFISGERSKTFPKTLKLSDEALRSNKVIPDEHGKELVACGKALQDVEIQIVHPESKKVLASDEIGEIWLKGGSVCQGYWGQEDLSKEIFQAYTADGQGPYLRTGDLGFQDGDDLFISSRIKDLIIIRGKNHYPHDIEQSIDACHPAFRPGGGVAFSADIDGSERLIVLHEIQRGALKKSSPELLFAAIRKCLSEEHELSPYAIGLLKRNSVLKTSSGKVRRRANKALWLEEKLAVEAQWINEEKAENKSGSPSIDIENPSQIQEWIIQWLCQQINMEQSEIDVRDSIAAYGVDSLGIATFETEFCEFLQVRWPVTDYLINDPSIETLADKALDILRENKADIVS